MSEALHFDETRLYPIDLTTNTDLGELFQPSALGISLYEDFVVIKAEDDFYYGFLVDYSGAAYVKIMYVKSATYDFASILAYGTAYNVADRRIMSIEYDALNSQYIAVISRTDTPRQVISIRCPEGNFPTGWVDPVVLINVGAGGQWDDGSVFAGGTMYFGNLYYHFYQGRRPTPPYNFKIGLAWGYDLRNLLTKSPDNPIYLTTQSWNVGNIDFRGLLQFDSEALIFGEGQTVANGSLFSVGAYSLRLGGRDFAAIEHPTNPIFDHSLGYVPADTSVANAFWLSDREQYRIGEFILYFNYQSVLDSWDRLRAVKFTSV